MMLPALGPNPPRQPDSPPLASTAGQGSVPAESFQSVYDRLLRSNAEAGPAEAPSPSGHSFGDRDETPDAGTGLFGALIVAEPAETGSTTPPATTADAPAARNELAEVFNARGILGAARAQRGPAAEIAGAPVDRAPSPDLVPPDPPQDLLTAAPRRAEGMDEPTFGRNVSRPGQSPDALRCVPETAPAKGAAAQDAMMIPPPVAARVAAAQVPAQEADEASHAEHAGRPQDVPEEMQDSTFPAHLLLSPGEGGLDVAARIGRDREARARLRDEIGALLARHGLRLTSLRLNGETNLRAPAGKEMD